MHFYHLCYLRFVRRQLGRVTTEELGSAIINYFNTVRAGHPASKVDSGACLDVAARVVLNLKPHDHVTPAL